MNFFKNTAPIIICLSMFVMSLSAQDIKTKTPEERAKMQTEMMKQKLVLTTVQTSKVQDVNLKYALKFEPIIKGKDSKFKKMKQAMDLQKAKDTELKSIFTTTQYKQYKDLQSEMKDKLKEKMK